MNRTAVLVLGAICWSVAAFDAAIHMARGDLLVPSAMAAALVVWIGVRATYRRLQPVLAD